MIMTFQAAAEKVLAVVEQQPQRQDSSSAQLADLRPFAVRLGVPVVPYLDNNPNHELSPRFAALLRSLPALPLLAELTSEQSVLLLRALANRLGFYGAADMLRLQLGNRC